jgi:hypothetical protein
MRILLRFDPFKASWTQVTHDAATADGDFRSEDVPTEIQKRGLIPDQRR